MQRLRKGSQPQEGGKLSSENGLKQPHSLSQWFQSLLVVPTGLGLLVVVGVLLLKLSTIWMNPHRLRTLDQAQVITTAVVLEQPNWNSSSSLERMVVVSRCKEEDLWLEQYFPTLPCTIYQLPCAGYKRAGANWLLPTDRGHEAQAYLDFIVRFYDQLPNTILFVHAHRGSWHLSDKVPVMRWLRWSGVPFANLRWKGLGPCNWHCPNMAPIWGPCEWEGNYLTPTHPTAVYNLSRTVPASVLLSNGSVIISQRQLLNDNAESISRAMQKYWHDLFGDDLGPLPDMVHYACGGEVLVQGSTIRRHPRQFYERTLKFLQNSTKFVGSDVAFVLEYGWHLMWGNGSAVMDPVDKCELLHCVA